METHVNGNNTKSNGSVRLKKPAKIIVKEAPTAKPAEKKLKASIVFVPPIQTVKTVITAAGISPLIVHAWSEKAIKQMQDNQSNKPKAPKAARDPVGDFEAAKYLDDKGRDCFPVIAFKAAAVEAGVLAGIFKTTLRKAFFVGTQGQDLLPLKFSGKPIMRTDMVRLDSGSADVRYRPEYRDWSVQIPVEFNPLLISAEQLYHLFDNAGYSIGVGEWRPQRGGDFGRFRVVFK
jgi:hypothetical protein